MHVYTGASQIRMSKAPGLRRRRTGLLPSGPKSSFQMRASFVFYLETKVLESGGRVEKLIAQVAWSPVLSFHSLWWFGVQCHLLVLIHCVFWKPTSLHPFTKTFLSTTCFLLLTSFLKMLERFSPKTKSGVPSSMKEDSSPSSSSRKVARIWPGGW